MAGPLHTATVDSPSTSGQQEQSSTSWLRPHLLKMAPYTPIEPFEVLSARYGRLPVDIIKLDANENPYGPPPEVRQALGTMAFPHIYPDPETRQLRKALAAKEGIPMEHLLVRQLVVQSVIIAHMLPKSPHTCWLPDAPIMQQTMHVACVFARWAVVQMS